jgi:alginate biosynthesis protein AlgX
MTPTRLCAALLAALVSAAAPAAAQSVYGCTDLGGRQAHASVEGANGVFYRILPDLQMFHSLSEGSAAQLGQLSAALAPLGTTLVYVPLPTKSLALPDQLPQAARDLGYDAALAATAYDQNLKRLRDAGLPTADLRAALRAGPEAPLSVFATDYRLTADGARRAARAIADTLAATPGFADLPKSRYESRSSGSVTLDSDMRAALQRHCMIALPPVVTDTFTTTRTQSGVATGGNTIFGARTAGARVALVGTEAAVGAAANLAGFLAEATGLEVEQYSVAGGGSFAAISSYLTSREFQDSRPAYLVWVNPAENNLAQWGDQPLRELIAAAGADCRVPLQLSSGRQANALTADLVPLDPGQSYTLFVDTDGAGAGAARFDFLSGSGLIRSRSVFRHPDQVRTGRFYMPMSGLWPEGAQRVEIVLDVPFGGNARVTACFD